MVILFSFTGSPDRIYSEADDTQTGLNSFSGLIRDYSLVSYYYFIIKLFTIHFNSLSQFTFGSVSY